MPENNSNELKGFVEAMIQTNTHLVRTIILILALFLTIFGIFFLSLKSLHILSKSGTNIKVSMPKSGLLIEVQNPDKSEKNYAVSQFLLPANDLWYDTGIELEADEECSFKISGKVNLALHKLVESTSNDEPTKVNWNGPEGSEFSRIGDTPEQDLAKKSLLLFGGDRRKIGNVVGYYAPIQEAGSFRDEFFNKRAEMSKKILSIGAGSTYPNNTSYKIRIFLSVNDILFDFSSDVTKKLTKITYLGSKPKPINIASWQKYVEPTEYKQLWYDDNIGSFLVSITIRKSGKTTLSNQQ